MKSTAHAEGRAEHTVAIDYLDYLVHSVYMV